MGYAIYCKVEYSYVTTIGACFGGREPIPDDLTFIWHYMHLADACQNGSALSSQHA